MIEFTPFYPEHVKLFRVQDAQGKDTAVMSPETVQGLQSYLGWTGWDGADCLGCAGFIPLWQERAVCWALFSAKAGPHLLGIARFIKAQLELYPMKRVEATVDIEFPEGHRLARLLGFRLEAPRMHAYAPDGRDMALYARVRG